MQKRIIKFRHFSEETNDFVEVHYIDFLRNGFGVQTGQSSDSVRWEYPDELELQQFTGLYDKNGKEIYEGDIVMTIDDIMLHKSLLSATVVEWNQNGFGWFPFEYCGGSELYPNICVVVSNIHRNPELVC
jgi:uncharacterized phage protein (TIGR01671 family)